MAALRAALDHIHHHRAHVEDPVIICRDSQATLALLHRGTPSYTTPRRGDLGALTGPHIYRPTHPSAVGVILLRAWGNEQADQLPNEASEVPRTCPLGGRTNHRAAAGAERQVNSRLAARLVPRLPKGSRIIAIVGV